MNRDMNFTNAFAVRLTKESYVNVSTMKLQRVHIPMLCLNLSDYDPSLPFLFLLRGLANQVLLRILINVLLFVSHLVKRVCFLNPCKNGGECVEDNSRYPCICPKGYSPPHCKGMFMVITST